MPMTKYERERVAEFYWNAVADILSSFLSASEEKEKCRPGDEAPKAADRENYSVDCSIAHGAGDVKEYERNAEGMNEESRNCASCKWLDQVKHRAKGEGYCCMVERSKNYKDGDKARHSNMMRCEFYEVGDWETRYKDKKE